MPCVPHIYFLPGFPTLPRKIATFLKLVHVVLAEILEGVSLYFDHDCLRKNKKIISGILGGEKKMFLHFFIKRLYFLLFSPKMSAESALFTVKPCF